VEDDDNDIIHGGEILSSRLAECPAYLPRFGCEVRSCDSPGSAFAARQHGNIE
jgi:hypothetical protein